MVGMTRTPSHFSFGFFGFSYFPCLLAEGTG